MTSRFKTATAHYLVPLLAIPLLTPLLSTPVRAANITLQGTIATDDAVQLFNVAVGTAGLVDIRSYGYAGGTISTGTVVPRGGFDTILTLFSASGVFIDDNDDGAGVATDPQTGKAGDARITDNLAAGSYIVALTQYDSFSIGNLADGFAEAGHPNFTADPAFTTGGPCPGNMFRDISGTAGRCRTGSWAVSFGNVSSATPVAPVPEPSVLLLTGLGCGALLLVSRFRHRRRATVLAGALAACASMPVHAQTDNCPAVASGPDYCHVSDFLNGERNLLNITDVQVLRISNYSDPHSTATNSVQFNTSNSTIPSYPDTPPNLAADSSRAIRTLSARMFNQPGAATLTAMNDLQGSNSLGVWLSNVASLPSNVGAWLPTINGDNPGVLDGAIADFNHDGYDDVVFSLGYGGDLGGLWVLTPNDVNDASKGPRRSSLVVHTAAAVAAGDFKGDGQSEIAGVNVLPTGGLQLMIYTVDPQTLQITLAKSLVLTTPGVSASTPITRTSMARGRFNSAGHDQIAVGFATDSGFTYVEIIDFTPGTLTPFEASPAPLYTPDSSALGIGYIQVKTGKFALPDSTYDSIVYHISTISATGKFFEILKVDPTTLAVSGTPPVSYNEFPCSFGLDVGNFDHRQQNPSNPNQTQPDPNDQITFTYCVGSARPDNANWYNTERADTCSRMICLNCAVC